MASDHRQRQCYYQQQPQQQEVVERDNTNTMMMTTTMKKGGGGGGVSGGVVVDERIWKACAGSLVRIPAVNSKAYYFPQGHVEQPTTAVPVSSLSAQVTSKPYIPCRVLHVNFLADPDTDEVFAKIQLQPLTCPSAAFLQEPPLTAAVEEEEGSGGSRDGVVSFAKVLTPSDANNGGGFSVPRFCADSIFPKLDFEADPPVQTIRIKDVHGESWDFRHIYRGTPRRHLLTTGWSKFVNSKKLVAGDSVVFIRNRTVNDLFVGVRRAVKPSVTVNDGMFSAWGPPPGFVRSNGGNGGGKGKVAAEKVVEAAERAASGLAFEVAYYPRPGVPEFVVAAERVERALAVYWSGGMRVKLATETEDSSRLQWFQGTVAAVSVPDNGHFRGSSWRMLEVKWDEHEVLKGMKRVNPWQVEFNSPAPPIHTPFPPTKKIKYSPNSGLFTDGEEEFPLPAVGFSSMMGQLSSSILNYNSFPAGMQGARQNNFVVSSLPNIMTDSTCQTHPENHVKNLSDKPDAVSTDLNIGKSPSDTPSPNSQNSVQFFSTAGTKLPPCSLNRKPGVTSFQLFGKIIEMEEPLNNTDEIRPTEYDDRLQCPRPPVVEGYVKG